MSVFDPNKCINQFGQLRTAYAGDIVDTYGTIRGSVQFDSTKVVDTFGNFGNALVNSQIGYINYPGTTHVQTWTANDELRSAAITASAAAQIGAIAGYNIKWGGNLSGAQNLTVAGPATSIGLDAASVTQYGGGTVTMTASNGISGVLTVENGAKLNVGDPANSPLTNTWVNPNATGSNIVNSGTLSYYINRGAATGASRTGTLTNNTTGVINFNGNPAWGSDYIGWELYSSFANNGIVNIDDIAFSSVYAIGNYKAITGTGTWNILDGGCFTNSLYSEGIPATQTFRLNGFGNSGTQIYGWSNQQAMLLDIQGNDGFYFDSPIVLDSSARIAYNGTVTNSGISSVISGGPTADLYLKGQTLTGQIRLTGANTFTGKTIIESGIVYIGNAAGTTLSNSAQVVMQPVTPGSNFCRLQLVNNQTIKSLSAPTAGAGVEVNVQANTLTINNNGITTVAARFAGSGAVIFTGTNSKPVITGASTGHTGSIQAAGGAVVTMTGSTAGQFHIWGANSKLDTGNATTGACTGALRFLTNTSTMIINSAGAGASKFTAGSMTVDAGVYKIDVNGPTTAGTYPILQLSSGFAAGTLPTLGNNTTGKTVTFSWNVAKTILSMTLA